MRNFIKNPFERKQKGAAVALCIVCLLLFMATGCGNKSSVVIDNDEEETQTIEMNNKDGEDSQENGENSQENGEDSQENGEEADDCEFCSCLDVENPEKLIPILNKFLAGLQDDLNGEQILRELTVWLKMQPCVGIANIDHYSAVKTDPPTGEIHISFSGVGRFYLYVMDVQWTNPITVTGFHDLFYEHKEGIEAVEVPTSEYSLKESACQWIRPSQSEWRKPILINSNEELEKFISCTEGSSLPVIDFTKHTLLLAFGEESGNVFVDSYLHRSSTGYVLNVDFRATIAAVIIPWQVAIVTDRIDKESNIEIKRNLK